MGVLSFITDVPGQVGMNPRRPKLITTASLSALTTAGYMNSEVKLSAQPLLPTDIIDCWYGATSLASPGTYDAFTVSISGTGVITLAIDVSGGNVTLPVVDNDFANFDGTTGKIKDSGYSPSDATKTKVVMAGSAVVTNRIAHFVDIVGTIDDTAAAVTNAGDIYAGLDAVAGVLRSYPATTTTGYLGLTGVANSGAFNVQISNAAHGQSTVYSIADIGASTGGLVAATSAIKMKSVAGASAAGGNAAQSFTDTFCTTGSNVIGNWNTQTNAASVLKIVPGNGSFVVTSSADAGSGTFNYIITK